MTAYKEIKTADNTFIVREKMTGMFQELYSGNLGSPVYVQQSKGWSINSAGALDVRYIYADEMHVKAFYADLELALAGGERITPSVAKIASNFAIPVAGASATLVVEELSGYTGHVFQDSDIIGIRQYTRSGFNTVTIGDVWGTVVYVTRSPYSNPPTQTYTFTRSTGGNAGSGSGTVTKGTLALDYGVSGQGYYEVTTIDGIAGANSPYAQIVTWTTHPASGTVVKTRIGNLSGITSTTWGALSGFGLYGNKIYLEGDCYINGELTFTNQGSISISGFDNDAGYITQASAPQSFYGSTEPTVATDNLKVGDFWFDTNSGVYKMKRCKTITPSVTWDNIGVYMDANGVYAGNITAGQVTAGTFTGLTFQTKASGQRVVIDAETNSITFYGSSGDGIGIWADWSLGDVHFETYGGAYWNISTGLRAYSYHIGNTGYGLNHDGSIDIPSGQQYKINGSPLTYSDVGAIASGGAYTDLSNASKIGTGSTQVSAGNHNHSGVYAVYPSGYYLDIKTAAKAGNKKFINGLLYFYNPSIPEWQLYSD